ncbi:MAG: hypothetical protein R3F42_12690 [Pseudomonadota bacterium]
MSAPPHAAAPKLSSLTAGVVVLLAIIGLGAYLINLYISKERVRDLQQWESRLALVVDSRADTIERWLDQRLRELQELADNASLQLYLWQLVQSSERDRPATEPAQLSYLRNLILSTADRDGYYLADTPRIPADLPQPQSSGLALLNDRLQPVVATPGMPEIGADELRAAESALSGGRRRIGALRLDAQGRALIAFAVPVHAVLGAKSGQPAPVGVVLGIRNADAELLSLLQQGATFAEDSEALLLEQRGDRVVYLSPGRDGSRPTRRSLGMDRVNLGGVGAVQHPGEFGVFTSYRGTPVLQLSRRLARRPGCWYSRSMPARR